jgi:hypothetical protein
MPLEDWVRHSRHDMFLYDWQTLIAGGLALLAGFGTVWMTRHIANRQIAASREEADRMVAAAREQTRATFKQTEMIFDLERRRNESEAAAFYSMLALATMTRVIAEADWARRTYREAFGKMTGTSPDAYAVRRCITKGAFAELRTACLRRPAGDLTVYFLDLERVIDNFAMQWKDESHPEAPRREGTRREGMHAYLDEQLDRIKNDADALRDKAAAAAAAARVAGL